MHHGAPSAQQQHLPRGQRRSRGRWRQALAHQTATSPQGRGACVRLGHHELLLQGVHPLLRGVGGGVGCTTSPEVDGATTAVTVPRLRVLQAPAVEGGREGPVLLPAGGGARRVGLPPARVHRGLLLLLVLAGGAQRVVADNLLLLLLLLLGRRVLLRVLGLLGRRAGAGEHAAGGEQVAVPAAADLQV